MLFYRVRMLSACVGQSVWDFNSLQAVPSRAVPYRKFAILNRS